MKRLVNSAWLVFSFFLLLFGCRAQKHSCGPLKDINRYQVILFVSPYGDFDSKEIAGILKEKLASFGKVIEAKIPIGEESPLLFISLEPTDSTMPSSIRVLGKVNVQKNGYELTSVIWSHTYEALPTYIPIEDSGKVSFVEEQEGRVPHIDLLDSLIMAFVKEYEATTSKKSGLTFLISQ